MPSEVASAYVSLIPSLQGARGQIERELGPESERAGSTGGDRFERAFKPSFGKLAAAGGALLAGKGLFTFLSDAVADAQEAAKLTRVTENIIKTTGGAANTTAQNVADLADALERKTGADGAAIQSGANVLLTFTQIRNEAGKGNDVFDQTVGSATDMATVLGGDASTAAVQLGKALNDPIKGITALSKSGVSFTEQQKEQIRTSVEAGDTLSAQKVILAELSKEFGGAAEAAASPTDRLRARIGQLQEAVGTALLPVIDRAATFFTNRVVPAFESASTVLANIGPVVGGVATATASATGFVGDNAEAFGTLAVVIGAAYVPALAAATQAQAGVLRQKLAGYLTTVGDAAKTAAGKASLAAGAIGLLAVGLFLEFQKAKQSVDAARDAVDQIADLDTINLFDDNAVAAARTGLQGLRVTADDLRASIRAGDLSPTSSALREIGDKADAAGTRLGELDTRLVAQRPLAEDLAGAFRVSTKELGALALAAGVDLGTATFDQAAGAITRYQLSSATAATTTGQLALQAEVLGSTTASAEQKTTAFKASLDLLFGAQLSAEQAASQYEAAVDNLTLSLVENNGQLDLGTEAGRASRESIRGLVTGLGEHVTAMQTNGATQDQLRGALNKGIEDFRASATQAGLTAAQVDALAVEYGLVPENVDTLIQQLGAGKTIGEIEGVGAAARRLDGTTATVTITARQFFNSVDAARSRTPYDAPKATGGRIQAGMVYKVGELGTELITPTRDAWVQTARDTEAMLDGTSGGSSRPSITNNLYAAREVDVDVLANRLERQLMEAGA